MRNLSSPTKYVDRSCYMFRNGSWHCSGMKERGILFIYYSKKISFKFSFEVINNARAKQRGRVIILNLETTQVIFTC
jgi:hypothetical protein